MDDCSERLKWYFTSNDELLEALRDFKKASAKLRGLTNMPLDKLDALIVAKTVQDFIIPELKSGTNPDDILFAIDDVRTFAVTSIPAGISRGLRKINAKNSYITKAKEGVGLAHIFSDARHALAVARKNFAPVSEIAKAIGVTKLHKTPRGRKLKEPILAVCGKLYDLKLNHIDDIKLVVKPNILTRTFARA